MRQMIPWTISDLMILWSQVDIICQPTHFLICIMWFQGFTYPVRSHFLEDILELTGHRLTEFNQIDDYGHGKSWKMHKQINNRKRKTTLNSLVEVSTEKPLLHTLYCLDLVLFFPLLFYFKLGHPSGKLLCYYCLCLGFDSQFSHLSLVSVMS